MKWSFRPKNGKTNTDFGQKLHFSINSDPVLLTNLFWTALVGTGFIKTYFLLSAFADVSY